jgi:hypothetical protein
VFPKPAEWGRVGCHRLIETTLQQARCDLVVSSQRGNLHNRVYIFCGANVQQISVVYQQTRGTAANEYHLFAQRPHSPRYSDQQV